MTAKEQLHNLVNELHDSELHAARRFLEYLRDRGVSPARRALAAVPIDDEDLSDDDRAALEEARDDVEAGRTVPHDEARRRLLDTA